MTWGRGCKSQHRNLARSTATGHRGLDERRHGRVLDSVVVGDVEGRVQGDLVVLEQTTLVHVIGKALDHRTPPAEDRVR